MCDAASDSSGGGLSGAERRRAREEAVVVEGVASKESCELPRSGAVGQQRSGAGQANRRRRTRARQRSQGPVRWTDDRTAADTTTSSHHRCSHHGVRSTHCPAPQNHAHIFYSIPRSSYYDKHYRQSAALIRARQPYLAKNLVTGAAIFSFAIGVCKLSPPSGRLASAKSSKMPSPSALLHKTSSKMSRCPISPLARRTLPRRDLPV